MNSFRCLIILGTINFCLGAGGGGGGSSASTVPEGGDDAVKILILPKPVELFCNLTTASGEDMPIHWYKNDNQLTASDRVVMKGLKLTIDPTEKEDVGTYKCQHENNPAINRTFDLVTLSYRNLPKSTTALEGDQFSLTCDAEGSPKPTITWTKDELPIEEAINGTHRLNFRDSEKGIANATIVMTEVQQSDRGLYTCFISNHPNIMYNSTTNVRVKDIYAALWPFLGIVVEVVVLCIIIFIYEKKRTKNDFDESDNDNTVSNTK